MLHASACALRIGACICCPHKSVVCLAATATARVGHRAGQLVSCAQSHPDGGTLGRGLLVACSDPTDTGCLRLMRWGALQRSWLTNRRARSSVATAANSCALRCVHTPARDFLWAYHKVSAMIWGLGAALFCPKELHLDTARRRATTQTIKEGVNSFRHVFRATVSFLSMGVVCFCVLHCRCHVQRRCDK